MIIRIRILQRFTRMRSVVNIVFQPFHHSDQNEQRFVNEQQIMKRHHNQIKLPECVQQIRQLGDKSVALSFHEVQSVQKLSLKICIFYKQVSDIMIIYEETHSNFE